MAHLSPLATENACEATRPLFDALETTFGLIPNMYRTMGHAPEILGSILRLIKAVHKDLPPKLRELAYLKVSLINKCDYCIQYHRQQAMQAGWTEDELGEIHHYESSAAFDTLQKAVLRFAEQLTLDAQADKVTINELKAFLSEKQLVILATTVGLANMTNQFNLAFEVQLP